MGDACEPWGYVAPVVAAVMTRATGVRHIYLIKFFLSFESESHFVNKEELCYHGMLRGGQFKTPEGTALATIEFRLKVRVLDTSLSYNK